MHDNDPKHISRLVSSCFSDNKVNVYAGGFKELNPIEHLWKADEKKIRICAYDKTSDLMNAIVKRMEWNFFKCFGRFS